MTKNEIMFTQERIGTDADGFWGPRSTAAAKKYLRDMTPKIFPTQVQVRTDRSIFGKQGERGGYTPPTKKIKLPFPLHLYGDGRKKVTHLSPHEECADSLLNVFKRLEVEFPTPGARKEAGILDYYGIYNPRRVRGGSVASMHAYAIAIDLWAPKNGNRVHWPVGAKMSIQVMECFAQEGWLSAGAHWSRDAMHFSANYA